MRATDYQRPGWFTSHVFNPHRWQGLTRRRRSASGAPGSLEVPGRQVRRAAAQPGQPAHRRRAEVPGGAPRATRSGCATCAASGEGRLLLRPQGRSAFTGDRADRRREAAAPARLPEALEDGGGRLLRGRRPGLPRRGAAPHRPRPPGLPHRPLEPGPRLRPRRSPAPPSGAAGSACGPARRRRRGAGAGARRPR